MKPQVELCQEFSDNMASKASEIDDLNDLEENPLENSKSYPVYDRFTNQPINRPINRYRPINRIGKSEKSQYRIGIGSADYKGLYRLIGFGSKKRLI